MYAVCYLQCKGSLLLCAKGLLPCAVRGPLLYENSDATRLFEPRVYIWRDSTYISTPILKATPVFYLKLNSNGAYASKRNHTHHSHAHTLIPQHKMSTQLQGAHVSQGVHA